jgi:uncharacterized protein
VRFWDSSAVVPLLIGQPASPQVSAWMSADDAMVIWSFTIVEIVSALRRLVREQALDEQTAGPAEARADQLADAAHVVADIEPVKIGARRLLRLHQLRASDALQLAAALHWAEGYPHGRIVHTLDARLGLAAQREGFTVPA